MNPRLLLKIVSMEARRQMSYRADFWLGTIVGVLVQFGLVWFLWKAVFDAVGKDRIAGMDFHALIFYYVLVFLIARVIRGVEFGNDISSEIYDGSLTRYLLYPLGYFSYKYGQRIGEMVPACLQFLLFFGIALLFMPWPDSFRLSAGSLAMAAGTVAVAQLLVFLIQAPVLMVAFWADNVWSLMVALRLVLMIFGGILFPVAFFPGWAREILRWLPFQYIFDFPVRVLQGQVGLPEWLFSLGVMAAWCAVLALVTRMVWRRGTLQYTGVGI